MGNCDVVSAKLRPSTPRRVTAELCLTIRQRYRTLSSRPETEDCWPWRLTMCRLPACVQQTELLDKTPDAPCRSKTCGWRLPARRVIQVSLMPTKNRTLNQSDRWTCHDCTNQVRSNQSRHSTRCRQGYRVKGISDGWSGTEQVFFMAERLMESLRAEIETGISELRYWESARTPHNSPAQGFISTAPVVGLSFPA